EEGRARRDSVGGAPRAPAHEWKETPSFLNPTRCRPPASKRKKYPPPPTRRGAEKGGAQQNQIPPAAKQRVAAKSEPHAKPGRREGRAPAVAVEEARRKSKSGAGVALNRRAHRAAARET